MTVLLAPNTTREDAMAFAEAMVRRLAAAGHEAYLYEDPHDPRLEATRLAIVAGGDGTVLRTVRALCRYSFPYWAVNFGHLGYLTDCEPSEADAALPGVLAGAYPVERRAMLCGEMVSAKGQERFHGLNEIVIHRGASVRPLHLSVAVDGTDIMRFAGDGLLVSTPTGSTAYNLSAGGPILMPESSQLVLAPVCAHSALCAPLVVSGQHDIRISLEEDAADGDGNLPSLDVDGCHRMILHPGDYVDCRLAPWTAGLVRTSEMGFYRRLQLKLARRDQ